MCEGSCAAELSSVTVIFTIHSTKRNKLLTAKDDARITLVRNVKYGMQCKPILSGHFGIKLWLTPLIEINI